MNMWTDILSADQLAAYHADIAKLDPAYAARNKAWFEGRTVQELKSLQHQAWNISSGENFMLARSYLALKAV